MNTRVGLAPSLNGNGHLRRLLSLAISLREFEIEVTFIFPNNVLLTHLQKSIISKSGVSVVLVDLGKFTEGPSVAVQTVNQIDKWSLLKTQKLINSLFDLIICDTVTWPIDIHYNVIFLGQFTWDLYYLKFKSLNSKFETTFNDPLQQLSRARSVISMKYFVWPEIADNLKIQKIGVLDYWGLASNNCALEENYIGHLVSGATHELRSEFLEKDVRIIQMIESEIKTKLRKPKYLLCRAGLGAVSESISSSIPPIFISSEDFEINHNSKVCINMGWGVDYDVLITKFGSLKNFLESNFNLNRNHNFELVQIHTLIEDFILPNL
jgi:hypothetical protein